jgi:hypothetical protein
MSDAAVQTALQQEPVLRQHRLTFPLVRFFLELLIMGAT